MSALRTATASLVFGIALSTSSLAWADLAPVEPEPDCSVESEQAKGLTDCQQCDTYHAEPHKCEALSKDGLHKSCQAGGASVWHEVWCKGEASAPPAEPNPSGCGACATTGGTESSSLAWLALGLCVAGVAARRRRK
ncbi:MAG: LPXTG cell wall anchor domain-containing protein [Polyangiaceae bacterium]|nr:LPXTG cell wall anchor domain-containing protein [Polyangiaceae bacterium]